MSAIEQFLSGGLPIGTLTYIQEAGDIATGEDSGALLRTGSVAVASAYPRAAQRSWLKCFGSSQSGAVINATAGCKMIADTTGQYRVILSSDATNVYVSSDYGQTFTAKAHGLAQPPTDGVFALGQFTLVGNSTTQFLFCRSTDYATTFTFSALGSVSCGSASSATANTARITASSTRILACAQANNATNGNAYSDTGSAFTAQNSRAAENAQPAIVWHQPSGLFIRTEGNFGSYGTSSTGLTGSWTSRTTPGVGGIPISLVTTTTASIWLVSGAIYSSTDAINWTARSLPRGASGVVGLRSNPITADGADLFMGDSGNATYGAAAFFHSSDNGATWTRYWVRYILPAAASSFMTVFKSGTRINFLPYSGVAQTTSYSAGFPASPDFVGSPIAIDSAGNLAGSASQTTLAGYYKVS